MKKTLCLLHCAAALLLAGVTMVSCRSTDSIAPASAQKQIVPEFTPAIVTTPETITFPSSDGVTITADVYMAYPDTAPLILLCHRAKWSRGEYREIAPKLNEQGFNAIAIDQRSGKTINGVDNMTASSAATAGKQTQFIDALIDIQTAVDYVKAHYAKGTFILWGSSYSASLGVAVTAANQNKIDAYLAFSPGEYFTDQGKSANWVASQAANVTVPVFFTSNNTEYAAVQPIFDSLASKSKTYYLPSSASKHGSEALFESNDYSYWTWKQVNAFLLPFAVKR
jgi:alpha-beta hydrolase superfamily lysophospholipase